jgi:flagellar motor switch protein FliM
MNVEPEEVEALMSLMGREGRPSPEVHERDFKRPRRLSVARLAALERALAECLSDVDATLERATGVRYRPTLSELSETSADGLWDEPERPLALLRFRAGSQVAWIVWENRAAVGAIESLLGSRNTRASARPLSRIEGRVLVEILSGVAERVCRALALRADGFVVAAEEDGPEGIGSWRNAPDPDAHRLRIELTLQAPDGPSKLALLVPAPAEPRARTQAARATLPNHLAPVEVELRARITGAEVSLAQLLALEPGDVIPLDGRLGDPARITVEGVSFALGTLGRRGGRTAIRLEALDHERSRRQS